ncbi:hypothetical protein LCGC14_0326410 [marine sediment metagenome]|uniref:Class I SAM-dependent methyltransferase n=1 Tax=marine sediment metagenome TaxID=412755 RepID=A0A0F9TNI6_9ZZZZ
METPGASVSSSLLSLTPEYQRRCRTPSDIWEHLPTLRTYAESCQRVTEFGVYYGNSTVAFLASRPEQLSSYDIHCWFSLDDFRRIARDGGVQWEFYCVNVLDIKPIEPTDLLFIDTWHHGIQLAAELELHASSVGRWLILHDTEDCGRVGSTGLPGMKAVVDGLIVSMEWQMVKHFRNCCGLTVLKRIKPPPAKRDIDWSIVELAKELSSKRFDADGMWIAD